MKDLAAAARTLLVSSNAYLEFSREGAGVERDLANGLMGVLQARSVAPLVRATWVLAFATVGLLLATAVLIYVTITSG